MSANKAKDTKPEIAFRKALWTEGIRGYRLNSKKAPDSPDIAFPGRKIAIFINRCYWHRCPKCGLPLPKTNTQFCKEKIERNISRDKKKNKELIGLGWKVLVFWECDLKNNFNSIINDIKGVLKNEVSIW